MTCSPNQPVMNVSCRRRRLWLPRTGCCCWQPGGAAMTGHRKLVDWINGFVSVQVGWSHKDVDSGFCHSTKPIPKWLSLGFLLNALSNTSLSRQIQFSWQWQDQCMPNLCLAVFNPFTTNNSRNLHHCHRSMVVSSQHAAYYHFYPILVITHLYYNCRQQL